MNNERTNENTARAIHFRLFSLFYWRSFCRRHPPSYPFVLILGRLINRWLIFCHRATQLRTHATSKPHKYRPTRLRPTHRRHAYIHLFRGFSPLSHSTLIQPSVLAPTTLPPSNPHSIPDLSPNNHSASRPVRAIPRLAPSLSATAGGGFCGAYFNPSALTLY